jgi:hypothetical protein
MLTGYAKQSQEMADKRNEGGRWCPDWRTVAPHVALPRLVGNGQLAVEVSGPMHQSYRKKQRKAES